jgi:hypothetical protein
MMRVSATCELQEGDIKFLQNCFVSKSAAMGMSNFIRIIRSADDGRRAERINRKLGAPAFHLLSET